MNSIPSYPCPSNIAIQTKGCTEGWWSSAPQSNFSSPQTLTLQLVQREENNPIKNDALFKRMHHSKYPFPGHRGQASIRILHQPPSPPPVRRHHLRSSRRRRRSRQSPRRPQRRETVCAVRPQDLSMASHDDGRGGLDSSEDLGGPPCTA